VGYGGSCFPKDVQAMIRFASDREYDFRILHAVESVNKRQKTRLFDKMKAHFGRVSGKTIAVWGLAFKPRTDDMREAPSLDVIEGLLGKGGRVQAFDPVAMDRARRILGDRVTLAPGPYEAVEGADGLFVVTEWNEFRNPDLERVKALMRDPVIFDGRNVFDPEELRELGFTWYGIGRAPR
jgi:UDPglucose 6-dehydrogenase